MRIGVTYGCKTKMKNTSEDLNERFDPKIKMVWKIWNQEDRKTKLRWIDGITEDLRTMCVSLGVVL